MAFKALGGVLAAAGAVTVAAEGRPRPVVAVAASIALPSTTTSTEPTFVSSLTSGAVSRASKEILLHPIDTVRARLQTQDDSNSTDASRNLYNNLYDGLVPALISGVPAGAIFFAVKDSSKKYLKNHGLSKKTATIISVAAANVPYWVVRNPSEVLKTRQQIASASSDDSLLNFLQSTPAQELYRGYLSNIGYAYPADVIKFLAYEIILDEVYQGKKPEGLQAAVAGASAGLVAQVSTTPLDVVRTRVMVDDRQDQSKLTEVLTDAYRDGALFKGVRPRALRAVGSGAIQFATYELTQNAFQK